MVKSKRTVARAPAGAGNVEPEDGGGSDKRAQATRVIRQVQAAMERKGDMPESFTFDGTRYPVDAALDHALRNAVRKVQGGAVNDAEAVVLALREAGHDVPMSRSRGR